MGKSYGETHVWFDGDHWHAYTERGEYFRRFSEWFGPPTRGSSRENVGHWVDLSRDALRIHRKKRCTTRTAPSTPRETS